MWGFGGEIKHSEAREGEIPFGGSGSSEQCRNLSVLDVFLLPFLIISTSREGTKCKII